MTRTAKLAGLLGLIAMALGCGENGLTAGMDPVPVSASPISGELSAFPAAEASYGASVASEIQLGEFILLPIEIDSFGTYFNDDTSNVNINVKYASYTEGMQGTGWESLDMFKNRATGWDTTFSYYSLDTGSDAKGWQLTGGYMMPLGPGHLKTGLSYGGLDIGSSDMNCFAPSLAYDYYISDALSVGLEWRYERISDDSGSFNQTDFNLNVRHLIEMSNPLLIKLALGRKEINNSPAAFERMLIGVDWVIADDWLVGFSMDRDLNKDNWGNWIQSINLDVAYQVTDSATVGINLKNASFSSGGNSNTGYSISYAQRF